MGEQNCLGCEVLNSEKLIKEKRCEVQKDVIQ